ncbi:uroporphyrinogen-III synthase [Chlorobium sp. N1]|uniref:uroporphyrinogen-III synthase n=1 Tax=Chlorobium sp. N1 TaxID=2491138 RepID=UPI00103D931D|nr:uroporphyrinogen-III synthase [Chlorobium sp. N1]TCD48598.1 uroporphyrinogen-III synthase [Chlorobium sp. N1]
MPTVLVTRPEHQAAAFVGELSRHNLDSVVFPTIEIRPAAGWTVPDLSPFSGIFFTSPNSVGTFMQRLMDERPDELKRLREAKVWAVGKTTEKDLGKYGVTTEPVPRIADAVNLMAGIPDQEIEGRTFLFLRGSLSLGVIPEVIAERGGTCVEITVYENNPPSLEDSARIRAMLLEGRLDCLSFTSPSTAVNFFDAMGSTALPEGVLVAAIGTTTAAALEKLGVRVDVIPEYFDGPHFAEAIALALKSR